MSQKTIIVTGGAGFIGSAVVRMLIHRGSHRVVNIDKLSYAGSLSRLQGLNPQRYRFVQSDICDAQAMQEVFSDVRPDAVLHLAAESHVDRSIDAPADFLQTNVAGTFNLLEAARRYLGDVSAASRSAFRFVHVSTDEVYGTLGADGAFDESSPYRPNSPYSSTKAASDHLARAWHETYDLPVIVTNCSNNFGPYQYPEKLIPVIVLNAIAGRPIPVYGRGENVRDWLHVEDHADALLAVMDAGRVGQTYAIGVRNERRNIDLVRLICAVLDDVKPRADGASYASQIEFVTDRPGHDLRYAINPSKLETELGWRTTRRFEDELRETVVWYLEHGDWIRSLGAEMPGRQGAPA